MIELHVNLIKIKENTANLIKRLGDVEMVAVVKGVNGDSHVAKAMVEGGAKIIADSRLEHFESYKKLGVETMFLRQLDEEIPKNIASLVDYALISNLSYLENINKVYRNKNKNLKALLLLETGFNREGLNPEEIRPALQIIEKSSNIDFKGFATNTACGVLPKQNAQAEQSGPNPIDQLCLFGDIIRPFVHSRLPTPDTRLIVSGGNSSILPWIENIPKEINQLRLGESILLGHDTSTYKLINGNSHDAFQVKANIVEDKIKNGQRQLLVDIGLQHIGIGKLKSVNSDVMVIHQIYSDYLALRVKDNAIFKGPLCFLPDYYALSILSCCPYVRKHYIN